MQLRKDGPKTGATILNKPTNLEPQTYQDIEGRLDPQSHLVSTFHIPQQLLSFLYMGDHLG